MKIKTTFSIFAILSSLILGLLAFPQVGHTAPAATLTVNSSEDASDLAPGDGACDSSLDKGDQCTLRAAIQEANALRGHDTIIVGAYAIVPATPLPALIDDAGATIRGNNLTSILDGNTLVSVGINIQSDNNRIQGLTIWNFTEFGIRVWLSSHNIIGTDGDGTTDAAERNVILHNGTGVFLMGGTNRVAGNYIGVFGTGAQASPNGDGIYVEGLLDAGCGTIIGTNGDGISDALEGNLISGNTNRGIFIHNSCLTVAGNTVGLNAAGTAALPNYQGVLIYEYAPGTRIGTDADGISDALERNVISGNTYIGLEVAGGASQVVIAGNLIGLNPAGDSPIPNETGIYVNDSAQVTIGTNDDGIGDDHEGNVISGNNGIGLQIEGENATQNSAAGNWIGTDSSGSYPIPNFYGISIGSGAHHNLVGNDGDGQGSMEERNLISGNTVGVLITDDDASHNVVAGNWIGTNEDGSSALPNTAAGIHIYGAPQNLIGGQVGNLISGNGTGILIEETTAISNTISFNRIGLNAASEAALSNKIGVQINAPNNLVGRQGDSNELDGNTISGNLQYGVFLSGVNSYGNLVAGNQIGTDADGQAAIPNGSGVYVFNAPGNIIGTDGDGVGDAYERNIISGNYYDGILVRGLEANGNVIAGNYIGVNASGNAAIKNGDGDWGVGINIDGAPNTLIGTDADGVADAAERNIISGNNTGAVSVFRAEAQGAVLAGNYIGTDASGLAAVPNGTGYPDQAVILYLTQAVRVGSNGDGVYDAAERNVISGNLGWGIRIFDGPSGHLIAGNYIGVDAAGSGALGNSKDGLILHHVEDVTVGGLLPALQNVIAYNNGAGIAVGDFTDSTGEYNHSLRGNAIFANAGLGIDLGSDGVTANDPLDPDRGPNDLQNYPLLSTAASSNLATTISGTLSSLKSSTFWLDFYASPTCDASAYGEGQVYLGSSSVSTNSAGAASFSVELTISLSSGTQVSATATGPSGTSEFSHCTAVEITDFLVYLPMVVR